MCMLSQMREFDILISNSEVSRSNSNILVRNYFFFLENDVTSDGAVSHNVEYHQSLIANK